MGAIASQITSLTIVYSTVYSGADQRKHQSSASLAFGKQQRIELQIAGSLYKTTGKPLVTRGLTNGQ